MNQITWAEWQAAKIDLHMHSLCSDGSLSPKALMERAAQHKLKIISLTDHDTTLGLKEAEGFANALDLCFIPGLEISAQDPKGALHILGYFFDPENAGLKQALQNLRAARTVRNKRILEKLKEFKIELTEDELLSSVPGGTVIGRPHIAQLLLKKGYVSSYSQAFQMYLAQNAKTYFDKENLSGKEAVGILKAAGGLAFIAHPSTLRRNQADLTALVKDLKTFGLDGIEVYNSAHFSEHYPQFFKLVDELGLAVSGGSDFHGKSKQQLEIGHAWLGKAIWGKNVSPLFFERYSSRFQG